MRDARAAAPLLIELARAVRACQYFEEGHATRASALKKATAVWMRALKKTGEFEVVAEERGFQLSDGEQLQGPVVDELSRSLRRHRVISVQVHPDLEPEELRVFAENLAREPRELARQGGLRGTLASADVRHVALWELPEATGAAEAAASRERPDADASDDGGRQLADLTVTLLRALAQLEPCDEIASYHRAAERVDEALAPLLAAGNPVDAYRAALVYSRHLKEADARSGEIRDEAGERLRALLLEDSMLRLTLEQALSGPGSTRHQAIGILRRVAPRAVAGLLDARNGDDANGRAAVAAVLTELGEAALAPLVEEVASPSPPRARQALRLLAEMKNPGSVAFLAERLQRGDPELRREVAATLACIGTPRTIEILCETLYAEPEVAVAAAQGLGACASAAPIHALIEVAENTSCTPLLRSEAIKSLGRLGDAAALPTLRGILEQSSFFARRRQRSLRVAAARAIARIGGERARGTLETFTRDPDAAVSQTCREALRASAVRGAS